MSADAVFPLAFSSDELRLLTGIVLGFLFGFSLERAGFGNARKLAAQFYLRDMSVLKVMFTAILVAMVGFYSLAALGLADPSMVWINPTFLWAQIIGGFLLGIGFMVSGLCPGTSVVAAVSGRIDGVVTLAGVFLGGALFAVAVDAVPSVQALYGAGAMGVSTLPELLGVPAAVAALLVLAGAVVAFIGAEAVERALRGRGPALTLEPAPRPRLKFALAGALAVVAAIGIAAASPTAAPEPIPAAPIDALEVAEAIIAGTPSVVLLDVRAPETRGDDLIPGARAADTEVDALSALVGAAPGSTVVLIDADGSTRAARAGWPRDLEYRFLRGGFAAWRDEVLTPAPIAALPLAERDAVARQNQIAAFFSGAVVRSAPMSAPPPAMPSGTRAKKKKAGGC